MKQTKIEVPVPSHCPECSEYEFSDSDKGNVVCPQCKTRYVIRIDPISGETTMSYFVSTGQWGENATPPQIKRDKPGVTFDPTEIEDNTIRLLLCGTLSQTPEPEPTPDDPDLLRCSFCNNPLSYAEATFGKKPYVTFGEVMSEDADGEVTIERVKLHRQSNVAACPDCSLKIKPSSTREICPACAGMKVVSGKPCRKCLQPRKRGNVTVMIPTGKVDGGVRSNNRWVSPEEM